ncbi:MAG: DUF6803 family protein [Coriobacteriia bacterium]
MTHYMALLQANQPWNLIIFMAIPVILAETLAITEFFILLKGKQDGAVRTANRIAGLIAGPYFLLVFAYLFFTAVIPLTVTGGWNGIADVIAVGFYLAGVIPFVGISLLEYRLFGKKLKLVPEQTLRAHATLVSVFLVVAHVAMIFGMLDPSLLGSHGGSSAGMPM